MKLLLWAAVCMAAAAPLFVGLGSVPFDDPGEGMHAEIARELGPVTGPFDLRLNGVRYVDKPPLLYWLIALAFTVFGRTEAAARAVSAVAAVAAVAATAWLGARLLGWRDGLAAGLVLLTSIWFFVYTRYVRPETLFLAALAWGFALALAGLERGRRAWVVGGLAAFGAAGLAKDPLGAVGPVLALAAGLTLARRLRPFFVLAFGWYVLVEARAHGFIWYTLVDNHVLNVLGQRRFPDEDVGLGLVEFMSVAALGAAPWTVAALAGVLDLVRRRAWRSPAELPWVVLAAWAVAVLAASAASRFRLPHYGLPAYPALALLAVRAWRGERSGRALAFLFAGAFALFAVGCWVEIHRGGRDFIDRVIGLTDIYTRKEDVAGEASPLPPWESFRPLVARAAAVFSAAALALLAAAVRGARRAALVLSLAAMAAILPAAARGLALTSAERAVRGLALTIPQRLEPGDRLLHEGPIENSGALEFYSGVRPVIVDGTRSVLGFGATFPDARETFWDTARLRREWTGRRRLFLVSTRRGDEGVVAALPPGRVRLILETGGRRLYANEPPEASRARREDGRRAVSGRGPAGPAELEGEQGIGEGPRAHEDGVHALAQASQDALDGGDPARGEDRAVPVAGLAPGQRLLDLPGGSRVGVGADHGRHVALPAFEHRPAFAIDHPALDSVHEREAVDPRRELRHRLVEEPRGAEGTEGGHDRPVDLGAHPGHDVGRRAGVLEEHLAVSALEVRAHQVDRDHVCARLGGPGGAAGVVERERLGVTAVDGGADHADGENLAPRQPILRPANVLAPDRGVH
ncbi:MAG: hypothetical protein DME09_19830 [Candidatus Rokuibacteriota bacterium]|nr:MAG: hypothetical protein DME09_19830 [Candidatus Rokubacteria bacterium]